MNDTDNNILDFKPVILETPEVIPAPAPAPKPSMRFRNFYIAFGIGRQKKANLLKAIKFAQELIPLQMKSKVMQKSIMLQHGLSAHQVRTIIRAASAKKHRERK